MKIALISRSSLYTVPGGDTVQITRLAKYLKKTDVQADIKLTHEEINYNDYELLHFFNITRPADILRHIKRSGKPFIVTPIFIDYSEYDSVHRKGLAGLVFKFFSPDSIEYLKTMARWLRGNDKMVSADYLWKGQRNSIRQILKKTALILPGSETEYDNLVNKYKITAAHMTIPNGIDLTIFKPAAEKTRNKRLVICAARIEGIKNQANLIKAMNNTSYDLLLIGSPAPNQMDYYNYCKKIAASNISFVQQISQEQLVEYYTKAKVHVLPSWFETCGLSSMEAAAMGCNIVITDKGYTRSYYSNEAIYCDPASPQSIFEAIEKAAHMPSSEKLQHTIHENYRFEKIAEKTKQAYKQVLHKA